MTEDVPHGIPIDTGRPVVADRPSAELADGRRVGDPPPRCLRIASAPSQAEDGSAVTYIEGSGAQDARTAAIDIAAVQQVMADLRSQGVDDPSLDEVAAVLGCDPAAVLGVLSSESAQGQGDGERPESAVEPA